MRQNTNQLSPSSNDSNIVKVPQCIEDLATLHVDTLTLLRRQYEENVRECTIVMNGAGHDGRPGMSEKAKEDQRKFREVDEEESYFFEDAEDKNEPMN
jgi:hypothetical protein